MIVCTAGHVDHGKTSLIKGITGIDTDRLEEEKKRGLTIEAGYAYCDINAPGDATGNAVRLGFVDMPGHERFVHNMLASISGIDLGLLIIAADDGPMPQTREHLEILQLLNMTKGAVIITKIDRVDNQTLQHTETTIQQFLRNSFLKNAPVFKVSNSLGTGFEPLKNYLWDTANHLEKKSTEQYFRMSIDRCFSLKGAGCIITGSVIAGAVSREQSLLISPSGIKARVRSIRVQNQNSDQAQTGDRCALNIAGADISSAQIQRGDWIIDEVLHKPTSRIDVLVTLLKDYPNNRPVHLHHGAQHLQARLTALDGKLFKKDKPKLAQLILHQSIHALSADYFILRDDSASRTIGGGQIIEPFASFKSRNTSEHVKTLNTLIISEHKKRYQALLNSSDFGLNISQLALSHNIFLPALKDQLADAQYFVKGEQNQSCEYAIAPQLIAKISSSMVETLTIHQQQKPDSRGLLKDQLRESLSINSRMPSLELVELITAQLIAKKSIQLSLTHYSMLGHRTELDADTQKIWKLIEPHIRTGGIRPPIVHELLDLCKLELKPLQTALKKLCNNQHLVQVAHNRFYLPNNVVALAKLAEQTAEKNEKGEITVIEFRNHTAIGRNLSIQVLEYFDQKKLTIRKKNIRHLIKRPDQLFS